MAKKLSKDMEKVKKGYQQIAKTGDKTLKSTGFNHIRVNIKAQQKVLSLIGELTTMKQISDRGVERKMHRADHEFKYHIHIKRCVKMN